MPPKSPEGRYTHFPVFLDLSEKRILFAGGGRIAARRLGVMSRFTGSYTVIAPEISDRIRTLALENDQICLKERECTPNDLDGFDIVFLCTKDAEKNAELSRLAREKGLLVNDAGNAENCDFYMPGVVTKDETVIGVTASGKDHYRAKAMRIAIAQMIEGEALDTGKSG